MNNKLMTQVNQTTSMKNRMLPLLTALTIITAAAGTVQAQFDSLNINLYKQLSLSDFGSGADNGNDCWGYTSASNREYALMGVSNALAIVEITDPANPVIVEQITHTNSLWGDVKVYQDYAYVTNESGGGLDVIYLGDVDNGNVTLVRRVTSNGLRTAHNVAVNQDSGYAYVVGANINSGGLVAYSLADPSNPVYAGAWTASYVHDAQIVTYPDNTEIAFCFGGYNGIYIVDVTDKNNMFTIKHLTYTNLAYCHQGWASEDLNYLYVDDELDEYYGLEPTTRTLVFDISDLSNTTFVNDFTTGLPSTDHNLYVNGNLIFESNYTSGVRVFDAADPVNPVEIAWFDTYPENNNTGFEGAWNVYPFFPSGTVIVSDINRGLFILDASAILGNNMVLDNDPLFAGQSATLRVNNASANTLVHFIYSLKGTGSTYVPQLNITLDLSAPKLAGSDMSDNSGYAELIKSIPLAAKNKLVWIQAAEYGRKSNLLNEQIN